MRILPTDEPYRPMNPTASDALELELRQIPGVAFVAFGEDQGATLVEVGTAGPCDPDEVRAEVLRLAVGYIEGPVSVEMVGQPTASTDGSCSPSLRVRLSLTLVEPHRPVVELHLYHRGRNVRVEARAGDHSSVAEAVIAALADLGLPVPFRLVAVHALSPELGAGTLVVFHDPVTGQVRRGLATGTSGEESTARAVLNALNRYLQSAPCVSPACT